MVKVFVLRYSHPRFAVCCLFLCERRVVRLGRTWANIFSSLCYASRCDIFSTKLGLKLLLRVLHKCHRGTVAYSLNDDINPKSQQARVLMSLDVVSPQMANHSHLPHLEFQHAWFLCGTKINNRC